MIMKYINTKRYLRPINHLKKFIIMKQKLMMINILFHLRTKVKDLYMMLSQKWGKNLLIFVEN